MANESLKRRGPLNRRVGSNRRALFATTSPMVVIAVVATAPTSKRSGSAGTLLDAALATLTALGHSECCAMVTKGNVASKRLFESRGFSLHVDVHGS